MATFEPTKILKNYTPLPFPYRGFSSEEEWVRKTVDHAHNRKIHVFSQGDFDAKEVGIYTVAKHKDVTVFLYGSGELSIYFPVNSETLQEVTEVLAENKSLEKEHGAPLRSIFPYLDIVPGDPWNHPASFFVEGIPKLETGLFFYEGGRI